MILDISHFISEMIEDRATPPQLLWNANRKSYAIYRMTLFSMTLSDVANYSITKHRAACLQQLSFLYTPPCTTEGVSEVGQKAKPSSIYWQVPANF